jgi:hypothetical protein
MIDVFVFGFLCRALPSRSALQNRDRKGAASFWPFTTRTVRQLLVSTLRA